MHHTIQQLKEETRESDQNLIKEHYAQYQVKKDLESTSGLCGKSKTQVEKLHEIVETQRAEIKKLEATIDVADAQIEEQQFQLQGVLAEKQILGTQLTRRHTELTACFESAKMQTHALKRGESQYTAKLDTLRRVRARIEKFRKEMNLHKGQVTNVLAIKREVFSLSKELLEAQAKTVALENEFHRPMNVHRWRTLESSDPQTYEMIQHVRALQKRLIQKSEEVLNKDSQIQEKEKMYVQLKSLLARQHGPEVSDMLQVYQQNLKDKTRQMKSMSDELERYQASVKEYNFIFKFQSKSLERRKFV
jgi:chromosome segregation ATPase